MTSDEKTRRVRYFVTNRLVVLVGGAELRGTAAYNAILTSLRGNHADIECVLLTMNRLWQSRISTYSLCLCDALDACRNDQPHLFNTLHLLYAPKPTLQPKSTNYELKLGDFCEETIFSCLGCPEKFSSPTHITLGPLAISNPLLSKLEGSTMVIFPDASPGVISAISCLEGASQIKPIDNNDFLHFLMPTRESLMRRFAMYDVSSKPVKSLVGKMNNRAFCNDSLLRTAAFVNFLFQDNSRVSDTTSIGKVFQLVTNWEHQFTLEADARRAARQAAEAARWAAAAEAARQAAEAARNADVAAAAAVEAARKAAEAADAVEAAVEAARQAAARQAAEAEAARQAAARHAAECHAVEWANAANTAARHAYNFTLQFEYQRAAEWSLAADAACRAACVAASHARTPVADFHAANASRSAYDAASFVAAAAAAARSAPWGSPAHYRR